MAQAKDEEVGLLRINECRGVVIVELCRWSSKVKIGVWKELGQPEILLQVDERKEWKQKNKLPAEDSKMRL